MGRSRQSACAASEERRDLSFHAVEGHESESMIKVAILKRRTMFMPMLMFVLILTLIKIKIVF